MLRNMLFIGFTIILIGCSENKHEHNQKRIKDAKTFGKQFMLAIELVDDPSFNDICKLLNDSITASPHSKAFIPTLALYIEEDEVEWEFIDCEACLSDFSEYNSFIIRILDKDTIRIDGKYGTPDDVSKMFEKFYNRQDSIGSLRKYKVTNEYFKDFEVTVSSNIIIYDLKNKDKLTVDEWKVLFGIGKDIVDYYKNRRDKIAINKLGQNYDDLNTDKKFDVSEVTGFSLIIILNIDGLYQLDYRAG